MVAHRRFTALPAVALSALLLAGCQGSPEPSSPETAPDDRYAPLIVRGQWLPANGTTARRQKGKVQVIVNGEQVDVNRDARLPSAASGEWYEDAFMVERGSAVRVFVTLPGGVPGMTTGCELEVDGVVLAREGQRLAQGNTVICDAKIPTK
ncbi:hypothetical protein [Micrococcus luteus]|uniref:hypothetical protein n=2 Tax=Micrococcus luteus TaxID=1270 RepID=UPI002A40E09F|nr:hypothetical protein [Micrococcus luteus]MCV7610000.1 hypothetical protein [Micrococcus luteus]MCV7660126.1 hypothetical protein [Micrococcus luteus]MCV7662066.1 hypothetical protein [Micrococcus luteus]